MTGDPDQEAKHPSSQKFDHYFTAQQYPLSDDLNGDVFVLDERNGGFIKGSQQHAKLNSPRLAMLTWIIAIVLLPIALMIIGFAADDQQFDSASTTDLVRLTDQTDGYITYTYTVNDQTYTNRDYFDNAHVADGQVSIQYLNNNPSRSRLARPPSTVERWLGAAGFLAFLFIPLYLPLFLFWRGYRLATKGRLLDGTITSSSGHYIKRRNQLWGDGDWRITIQYNITTPEGRRLSRQQSSMRNDLAGFYPKIGRPLKVLYLNDVWFKAV